MVAAASEASEAKTGASAPVVAEEDPDASARAPASRTPRAGQDIPHDADLPDDAEGAGGRGQPDPGLPKTTTFQPGGSPKRKDASAGGPGQDSHEGD